MKFLTNVFAAARRALSTWATMQPTRVAEAVRLTAAAIAATGWIVIPDWRINAVASAAAALTSVVATIKTWWAVVPVAKVDGCTGVHEHDPVGE